MAEEAAIVPYPTLSQVPLQGRGWEGMNAWVMPRPAASPANNPSGTMGGLTMVNQNAPIAWQANAGTYRTLATTPWVHMAIDVRKDQLAAAEWDIVQVDHKGPKNVRLAQRIRELFEAPNAIDDDFQTFIQRFVHDLLVLDAGVAEVVRYPGSDEIAELWPVPGEQIGIDRNWDGSADSVRYYWIPDGTVRAKFRTTDLLYVQDNPRTDNPIGVSPIQILLGVIDSEIRAMDYNRRMVSGAAPDGVLNIGESALDTDVQGARSYWDSNILGKSAMAIIGGFKQPSWMPFRSGNREAQFMEWVDLLIRCIAGVYGLSPMDLMITFDVNRSCYSEDTQTLTENGWKFYWEVKEGERIATFNPESEKIEYHVPSAAYIYPYSGRMVHFQTKGGVDVLVTPDHDMWVKDQARTRHTKPWRKMKASELTAENHIHSEFTFRAAGAWDGDEVERFVLPSAERLSRGIELQIERQIAMDDWLEFLGYVISEGCIFEPPVGSAYAGRYKVMVSQSIKQNPEKAKKIGDCLNRLPIRWGTYVDQADQVRRWQVSDKALWIWLRENVGGRSATKFIPPFVRNLSARQQQIIFDALMLGDGSVGPGWMMYYTISDRLADDFQEMALRLGYRASRRYSKGGKVNVVSLVPPSRVNDHSLISTQNVTEEDYEGIVYCFNVPNHLFVTRRNGKIGIHGNTAEAQSQNTEDRGLRPLMGKLQRAFTRRIVQDESFGGRANNLAFRWTALNLDETQQKATINKTAMPGIGWKSVNEARLDAGRPPIGDLNDEENPFNHILIGTPKGALDINTQTYLGEEQLAALAAKAAPAGDSAPPQSPAQP